MPAVTDTSDLARRLGDALGEGYAVERALGQGGFAVVFLVRDLALKRNLAVKVLSPDMITSKTVLERFRREAETVAQLAHPNIVPLYFIGQQDDLLYLAMQCVDGGSIADRLERERPLPVADAVRITCEIASALAHAHKRGVIHRDIKPANVLVDAESGRCLVTDFGIARTADATTLTATGMMVGTPAYLSPEQVTGEAVDHRVDIFALGVMAYEMLAGQLPFAAQTPSAALMKRLGGPPEPLSMVRPEVSRELSDVIAQCLAADVDARFQSAGDVVRALSGEFITTGGRATLNVPTMRKPRAQRRVRVAVALVVLAAASVVTAVAARSVIVSRSARPPILPTPSPSVPPAPDSGMVMIPAGDYVIGADAGPALARPRHTEQVSAFAIDRTEVTVGAYQAFVAATHAPAPWTGAMPGGTLPVTRVRWDDAVRYCVWRHPRKGRLPTEVEWEAAARGPSGRAYPYGGTAEAANGNTASAKRKGPVPVGSFPLGATPEGLQDMSGNVWEWTSSPLAAYPGAPPLADSMSEFRVIRGGAFDTSDEVASAWWRGYQKVTTPASNLPNTGFRCAMSPR